MSIKALTWARALTVGGPTRKLVLLALADRANEETGWSTWVGQDTLAAECELSRRSVIRVLAQLEEVGVIRRERRHREDGTRTSDVVYLVPGWAGLGDRESRDPVSHDIQSRDNGRAPYVTASPDLRDTGSQQEQEEGQEEEREVFASDVAEATPDPEPSPAEALCHQLADHIAARGSKRPTVTARWVADMDRLIRLDHREPNHVAKVLNWLATGADEVATFWRPNIRSPGKLREQWDHMAEQFKARRNGTHHDRTEQAWQDSQALVQAAPDHFNPMDALTGGTPS